jgi:hypothetical protein
MTTDMSSTKELLARIQDLEVNNKKYKDILDTIQSTNECRGYVYIGAANISNIENKMIKVGKCIDLKERSKAASVFQPHEVEFIHYRLVENRHLAETSLKTMLSGVNITREHYNISPELAKKCLDIIADSINDVYKIIDVENKDNAEYFMKKNKIVDNIQTDQKEAKTVVNVNVVVQLDIKEITIDYIKKNPSNARIPSTKYLHLYSDYITNNYPTKKAYGKKDLADCLKSLGFECKRNRLYSYWIPK